MTANERHFKRDAILSAKHRTWGFNVPAVDIDFLMIEYDQSVAKALVEYRHINGAVRVDASVKAIIDLADRAGLPFFIVQYYYATDDGTRWKEATVDTPAFFRITTMNKLAEQAYFSWGDEWMSEQQYREWLHEIRGRKV
ncbi:MAG: hypothetical protein EBT00_17365 [Proteobacteria bacterium]|nr:hypothetical protein [Pseudomonadota bacterium]